MTEFKDAKMDVSALQTFRAKWPLILNRTATFLSKHVSLKVRNSIRAMGDQDVVRAITILNARHEEEYDSLPGIGATLWA
jgi:hypothetical protein